ncbi:MAG: 30S ribosome-binding factor RbfA [Clostridiales bacterium]|nr:30S ribosome-binding factor RbfA [Clostridiales bacterium]
MTSHRSSRVAEEIKKELSDIIRHDMNDPRVKGLVSVTHVEVSRDISTATIFLSCLGEAEEQANTVKAFKQAGGYIRGELAGRLHLRFIPELLFRADNSIRVGARINALINQQNLEMQNRDQQRREEDEA